MTQDHLDVSGIHNLKETIYSIVLFIIKNGTIQDNRTGIPLSHGCVRLEIQYAKWIYDNIPSGTKVVVY